MSDYLKYIINVDGKKATNSINNFKKTLSTLGQKFKETSASMKRFQTHQTKLNTNFNNINRDGNRTSRVFTSLSSKTNALGSSFNRLNKFINLGILFQLGRVLAGTVNSAVAMTETANLFSVSLGDMTFEADQTISTLSELYGLDTTNLRSSTGTFSLLARSMGMSSEQARILGTNTTQLAIDLSSLMNVPLEQVMGDLRSGLVGQSETVYKYGIDVTEAGIKAEAMAEGITKSVRNMSQGEKMALRYNVMLKQTGLAHGDFARTIDTPANQMKILNERFTTLSRAIGTIFIPILKTVLPYLNAVVKVLINVANIIASLFGYKGDPLTEGVGGGLNNVTDDADALDDSIGGATNSAKKLKNALMGFDEVNVSPEESDSSSGGSGSGVGGDSILDQIELSQMEILNKQITQQSDAIALAIEGMLSRVKNAIEPFTKAIKTLWNEGLSLLGNFVWENLKSFYEHFLVPIGKWAFGENTGLTRLVTILNDLLKKIDWEALNKAIDDFWIAIEPYAEQFGEGLIDFFEDFGNLSVDVINLMAPAIEGLALALEAGDPSVARSLAYALSALATSLLLFKVGGDVLTALISLSKLLPSLAMSIGIIGMYTERPIELKIHPPKEKDFKTVEEYTVAMKEYYDTINSERKKQNESNPFGYDKDGWGLDSFSQKIKTFSENLPIYMENARIGFEEELGSLKMSLELWWEDTWLANTIWNFEQFWNEKVMPWFTVEKWSELFANIKLGLEETWNSLIEWWNESTLVVWWEKDVSPWFTKKKWEDTFSVIKTSIKTTWDNLVTQWATDISTWWAEHVEPWFNIETWEELGNNMKNGMYNGFVGIVISIVDVLNGILDGVENLINDIMNGLNALIEKANTLAGVNIDFRFSTIEFGQIPTPSFKKMAKGGIVGSSQILNVGEDGKEAIIPLENNLGWIDTLSQMIVGRTEGSIGNSTPLEVTFELNGKRFAQATLSDFENEARRQGGLRVKLV